MFTYKKFNKYFFALLPHSVMMLHMPCATYIKITVAKRVIILSIIKDIV